MILSFLDKIANRICDIDNDTMTKYYGTYCEFLTKKTLMREDYIRQYSAQQKEIKRTGGVYQEKYRWTKSENGKRAAKTA